VVDEIVHYCVANMPGAVPVTSTQALTNLVLPYVRELARLGFERALEANPGLRAGVNVMRGKVVHRVVADSLELEYTPLEEVLTLA
jgi:alanine dehydrogenase